jgi:hypothetical protein
LTLPLFELDLAKVLSGLFFGILGGGVYALLWYRTRAEWFEAVKRIILGAVVGILYQYTGFPNELNTFTAGYMAIDVLEFFITRYKDREPRIELLPPPPPPSVQEQALNSPVDTLNAGENK